MSGPFVPMDPRWWKDIAVAISKPWPLEAAFMDLRWHADQVRCGRLSRGLSQRAAQERWGWGRKRVRLVMASDTWRDGLERTQGPTSNAPRGPQRDQYERGKATQGHDNVEGRGPKRDQYERTQGPTSNAPRGPKSSSTIYTDTQIHSTHSPLPPSRGAEFQQSSKGTRHQQPDTEHTDQDADARRQFVADFNAAAAEFYPGQPSQLWNRGRSLLSPREQAKTLPVLEHGRWLPQMLGLYVEACKAGDTAFEQKDFMGKATTLRAWAEHGTVPWWAKKAKDARAAPKVDPRKGVPESAPSWVKVQPGSRAECVDGDWYEVYEALGETMRDKLAPPLRLARQP